jgi:glycosyltransferase involved in cell wall biosynthesis
MVDPAPNDSRASSAVDAIGASLKRLPNEPFLLFVGALRRVKGVEQLLAAYARLTNPPPLVLLGTLEPDSPPFPPAVHVITDVPHEAVMAAWDRCLFGVLPSLLPEPFGTVVCEAMSRGKAVIGTRPGGHADMILDGETGILVPAGDVRALAEAMGRLIADSELRERMGQAGQRRAALFARDTILPDVELVYERVLAPGPPRPT